MKTIAALLTALMLSFSFAATPAFAAPMRFPEQGAPAFTLDVPDTWRTEHQGANLQLFAGDNSGLVQLTMVTGDDLAQHTDEEMVGIILNAAGLPAYSQTKTFTIDGRQGNGFFSTATNNGTSIRVWVILIRLDATHMAVIGDGRIGSPSNPAMDRVMGSIRIR